MNLKEIGNSEKRVFLVALLLMVLLSFARAVSNDGGLSFEDELKVFVTLLVASIHIASLATSIVLLIFKKWGHLSFLGAVLVFAIYSFLLSPKDLAFPKNKDATSMPKHH